MNPITSRASATQVECHHATWRWFIRLLLLLCLNGVAVPSLLAAEVFIYSSQSSIRGLDLNKGTDRLLTNSPYAQGVNALAYNLRAGIVYYGDGTTVYRWDPADGNGASAHVLMNDFSAGPLTAPITNINSSAGSYLDGKYYVGSESNTGHIQELYELTMSIDGSQVVSVRPLNLLSACACSEQQLGGFGDVAAVLEGGVAVLYGSSADLGGSTAGSVAGRWKFSPSSNSFQALATGSGGQMSSSPSGKLYSNVGNSIREVNTITGAISAIGLMNTSASIYDFTGGFFLDFGDAPGSYGAAFHRLTGTSTTHIGLLAPDNEAGSLNASSGLSDGQGDDTDGSDDEDAIEPGLEIAAGTPGYSLTLACTAGARVAGWIDSNINGVFDMSERNVNHPVTCSAGEATLLWTGLSAASTGTTYMRLRASTNASAVSRPVGVASDGEVEDHQLVITGGSTSSASCPVGSVSHRYSASDLPVNIGPNANTTAVSSIFVSDTAAVLDVNILELDGSHTYINDLRFSLRHSGTTRRLYGPSCGSQNDFSFGFDDSASGTPPCPPTDGNIYPSRQQLSNFNGQDASGNWQLRILDRYNGDGGSFDRWTLELCLAGTAVVDVPDMVLGKSVEVDGRDVTIRMVLRNSGNVTLHNISLQDDLDGVFGSGNYTMTANPVIVSGPAGIIANSAFDGSTNTQLLSAAATLAVKEQLLIEFQLRVDTLSIGTVPGAYSNQALAVAISPTGVAVSDLSGAGLDVAIDIDTGTDFQLDAGASLTGSVFLDTSVLVTQSHDGIKQVAEVGIAGRVVNALDALGNILASTSSNVDGEWRIDLPAVELDQQLVIAVQGDSISRFVSEAAMYGDGIVTDGRVPLSPTHGDTLTSIDFGLIQLPSLGTDHSSSVIPGSDIIYAHAFNATTHGSLDVALGHITTPVDTGWLATLYSDQNCDGAVNTVDAPLSAPVLLVPGDTLCVLVISQVPNGTQDGAIASSQIDATFSLSDASGTGHGLAVQLDNTDVTTVVRVGNGRLELAKTVRNVSLGGAELTANSAQPGQVLEYRITYMNAGNGPLSDVLIEDPAPAFTQVQTGSPSCISTPPGLSCAVVVSGDSISWIVTGILNAGQSGAVRYQVLIE